MARGLLKRRKNKENVLADIDLFLSLIEFSIF